MPMLRSILKVVFVLLMVFSCQSAFAAIYDVTSYGAVGTGNEADASTNATAFEDAIAAAGVGDTVYAPPGVYYVSDQVKPNKDNLVLDGYGATIKRVSGGVADLTLVTVGTSDGVVIQGFTIDGNRSVEVSSTSFGISNYYGDNVTIKDCNVINCETDGIYLAGQRADMIVDNCTLTGNNRLGLAITDSAGYCVIKNCDFSENTGGGIDIEPNWRHTSGHVIQNCTFDAAGAGDSVLQLFGHSSWYVWDVLIEDCNFMNGAGIRCNKSMKITANNNTFTGGGAIKFNDITAGYRGAGQITLTGNTFDGSSMAGGSNLLSNAGFESWTGSVPDSWSMEGAGPAVINKVSASSLEGSLAAHVDADGPIKLKQTISVTAGNHYTFGGYISYLMKDGGNKPYIYVDFLDSGSGVVKTVNPMSGYYQLYKYRLYEKVMGIAKAPAGAVSAEIGIGRIDAGGYEADFDGMFFVEGIGNNEDLTASQNKVMRFDFGPGGPEDQDVDDGYGPVVYHPHADYIGVKPSTTYGYDPNTGLTYGVVVDHWLPISGRFRGQSAGWTSRASSDLALTYLAFPKPYHQSGFDYDGGWFELELPNGLYYVTVAAGNPAWDNTCRLEVEGGQYRADYRSDNLYILDIAPEPVGSGGPLKWDLDPDLDPRHGFPHVFGRVKLWGANAADHIPPTYYEYSELLYLKDQIVEITDGKLTVEGGDMGSGEHYLINFLEVVRVPITDCESVWASEFGLSADFNKDCRVDIQDLAEMINDWLDKISF